MHLRKIAPLIIMLLHILIQPSTLSAKSIWQADHFSKRDMRGLQVETTGKATTTIDDGKLFIHGGYKGDKVTLNHTFKTAPFPTEISTQIRTPSTPLKGRMIAKAIDLTTGAFICVMRTSETEYAWTSSEDGHWHDWKRYFTVPPTNEKISSMDILQTGTNEFRIVINKHNSTSPIVIENLGVISGFTLTSEVEGNYELISIEATQQAEVAEYQISQRLIDTNLIPRDQAIKATNPHANGYQIAYFERGFSDGMTDPIRRNELVESLRKMHVDSLRFPGGTWAYYYSSVSEKSVAAFAKLENSHFKVPYWVKNFNEYRWANDDYFFGICKELNSTAIYQINIATWYDADTDRAVKLAPFDRRMKEGAAAEAVALKIGESAATMDVSNPHMENVEPAFMKDALANITALVHKAKAMGVEVVWEFGNEDYTKFKPASYVRQSKAFYDAIKRVDPQAQFAFCADGDSWTDREWDDEVYSLLVQNGMADVAEASTHMYLTGGGGGPRDSGENIYNATITAWNNLRNMHQGMKNRLENAGLKDTNISLTEFNVAHVVPNYTGKPMEHSMGRALGEAAIWPDLITKFNYINFHDLIRNGYGHGTWFTRLYYLPDNPEGFRYVLPLDAKVMAVMHQHAANEIIQSDNTWIISQNETEALISIGNPNSFPISYTFSIHTNGWRLNANTQWNILSVPNLNNPDYTAFTLPLELTEDQIRITVPAFSFSYLSVPLD